MEDKVKKIIMTLSDANNEMDNSKHVNYPGPLLEKGTEFIDPLHLLLKGKLERASFEKAPEMGNDYLKKHEMVTKDLQEDFSMLRLEVKTITQLIFSLNSEYQKPQIDLEAVEDVLKSIVNSAKALAKIELKVVKMAFGQVTEKLEEIQKSAKDMIEDKARVLDFKKQLLKLIDLTSDINTIIVNQKKVVKKEVESVKELLNVGMKHYKELLQDMGIDAEFKSGSEVEAGE